MHTAKLLFAFISHRNKLGGKWLLPTVVYLHLLRTYLSTSQLFPHSYRQYPRAWIHCMLTRQQPCSADVLLLVKQNLVLNLGVVTYAFKHSIGKSQWISMSFQASHAYIVT